MSKRLTGNLNTKYMEAANKLHLSAESNRKKVVCYVESYTDIFFWRSILDDFRRDGIEFQIMLPSRTNLSRGKKQAMMNRLGENLGKYMIACVDSDYDYLLQGASPTSREMLTNPFVLQTYTYSIENYQCYAPSLHEVCVMSTLNDRRIFDFEEYMRLYSNIVYELFVWSVWLYRNNMYKDMPLNSFLNFVSVEKMNIMKPGDAMEDLRHRVNRKVAYMQRNYPKAKGKLGPLKQELETLGVTRDNVYLFVQGHHILENVVMAAMDPVCTLLRREREREIKNLANGRKQQMDNELASYNHSQCPIDQMLRRNTDFKDSDIYQLLKRDIEELIGLILEDESDENTKPAPYDNSAEDIPSAARETGSFDESAWRKA